MTDSLDKASGGVEVLLGGVKRELKFTFHALKQVKKTTGLDLIEAGNSGGFTPNLANITALIWAGFLHYEDDTLTQEYIDKQVGLDNLAEISTAIHRAFDAARVPDSAEEEVVKKKK